MILDPYQETGADYLAARHRAGLFDDMGVGKTAQAIGALDRVGARRVIVVAPAKAHKVGVWKNEFRKFETIKRKIIRAQNIADLGIWKAGKADALFLSYERATNWAKHLQDDVFDAIVFDESHRMKSGTAQRTRAMLSTDCDGKHGVARWANHAWFLSGTPMANDPSDLWTVLRFCGATTLTYRNFCNRYFIARAGAFSTRYKPREELAEELRGLIRSMSLRRTAADVGLNLPPLYYSSLSIDGDTTEVRALLAEYPGLDQTVLDAVQEGGLSFLDSQHIATLRRLVGEAKAPVYAELLAEELEDSPGKRVVGGLHTRAIDIVEETLRKAGVDVVKVTGKTGDRNDEQAVERFQNDPNCRVFLGQLQAAGEAITLHAADRLDIFEESWSPKDNAQFIKRIHRRGQEQTCFIRFISLSDSIDEKVSEVVIDKTKAITSLETSVSS